MISQGKWAAPWKRTKRNNRAETDLQILQISELSDTDHKTTMLNALKEIKDQLRDEWMK